LMKAVLGMMIPAPTRLDLRRKPVKKFGNWELDTHFQVFSVGPRSNSPILFEKNFWNSNWPHI
jgi:hypothetical protein